MVDDSELSPLSNGGSDFVQFSLLTKLGIREARFRHLKVVARSAAPGVETSPQERARGAKLPHVYMGRTVRSFTQQWITRTALA